DPPAVVFGILRRIGKNQTRRLTFAYGPAGHHPPGAEQTGPCPATPCGPFAHHRATFSGRAGAMGCRASVPGAAADRAGTAAKRAIARQARAIPRQRPADRPRGWFRRTDLARETAVCVPP